MLPDGHGCKWSPHECGRQHFQGSQGIKHMQAVSNCINLQRRNERLVSQVGKQNHRKQIGLSPTFPLLVCQHNRLHNGATIFHCMQGCLLSLGMALVALLALRLRGPSSPTSEACNLLSE